MQLWSHFRPTRHRGKQLRATPLHRASLGRLEEQCG